MSFLYPRTVTITRETATTTAGLQPMQEFNGAQVTTIAASIPCGIAINRDRGKPLTEVPGDTQARSTWKITIGAANAHVAGVNAPNSILTRDELIDDAGLHYQVAQSEWTPLGWNIRAELLMA